MRFFRIGDRREKGFLGFEIWIRELGEGEEWGGIVGFLDLVLDLVRVAMFYFSERKLELLLKFGFCIFY